MDIRYLETHQITKNEIGEGRTDNDIVIGTKILTLTHLTEFKKSVVGPLLMLLRHINQDEHSSYGLDILSSLATLYNVVLEIILNSRSLSTKLFTEKLLQVLEIDNERLETKIMRVFSDTIIISLRVEFMEELTDNRLISIGDMQRAGEYTNLRVGVFDRLISYNTIRVLVTKEEKCRHKLVIR